MRELTPSSMSATEKIILLVVGLLMIGIITISWVPQPCPILRKITVGCTKNTPLSIPQTYEEQELARVAHETITTPLTYISAAAQDYRKTSLINFNYQADPEETITLLFHRPSGYVPVATISSPVLSTISWGSVSTRHWRVYQKEDTYHSVDDFLKQIPTGNQLAADAAAVEAFSLAPGGYVPLTDVEANPSVKYIIVAYNPPIPEGAWKIFTYELDAQDAVINARGELEWQIMRTKKDGLSKNFQLGTIHVNYQSMHE